MVRVMRILAAAGLVAGAASPALFAQGAPAADEGKALFKQHCAMCHALDTVTVKRAPAAEWREVVERMRTNGAEITPGDGDKIIAYLAANYGA